MGPSAAQQHLACLQQLPPALLRAAGQAPPLWAPPPAELPADDQQSVFFPSTPASSAPAASAPAAKRRRHNTDHQHLKAARLAYAQEYHAVMHRLQQQAHPICDTAEAVSTPHATEQRPATTKTPEDVAEEFGAVSHTLATLGADVWPPALEPLRADLGSVLRVPGAAEMGRTLQSVLAQVEALVPWERALVGCWLQRQVHKAVQGVRTMCFM